MKNFMHSVNKHRHVVFASTTPHGVGALHLRHKIPLYKILQVCNSLGFSISSELKHRNHLKFRNGNGELVATLVNLNLVLLPKYAKTKNDSVSLAEAFLK